MLPRRAGAYREKVIVYLEKRLWVYVLACGLALLAPIAAARVPESLAGTSSVTHNFVVVGGKTIHYKAVAGTLVLKGDPNLSGARVPQVSMGYFAYFKSGSRDSNRPITFLWNGGEESASLFLQLGAFGPWRVITNDHSHTPPAPYKLVRNEYSLLDASDLVFVDGPGAGFARLLPQGSTVQARIASRQRLAKAAWNTDGDAENFARFIMKFLSKYDRWNSPKYIFGESYGTMRSAIVANILENRYSVDLNGVIQESQVLNGLETEPSPGSYLGDLLVLPSYAAVAWYHHMLPMYNGKSLHTVLSAAEALTNGAYRNALYQGSNLSPSKEHAVAVQLHNVTGLPTAYWQKAHLIVTPGMFQHELLSADGLTVGNLDGRAAGPSMDPMSKTAEYDPQMGIIGSPYISMFNEYLHTILHYGMGHVYTTMGPMRPGFSFNFTHTPVGVGGGANRRLLFNPGLTVMNDLADAMKYNPHLRVMVNEGYFDLNTPFYTAMFDMAHLPIPRDLKQNIEFRFYDSGHMIYVHVPALKKLHDNIAQFIRSTDNLDSRK